MCDLEEFVVEDILHPTTGVGSHSVANEEDHRILSKGGKDPLGKCYGLNVCAPPPPRKFIC